MIKAGIIGSTGYAGMELVRLLMQHPETEIVWYGSRSYVGKPYEDIYRNFFRFVEADCLDDDLDTLADEADVIFTATPQGFLAERMHEELLEKARVIDLSADYRFKDAARYEAWYGMAHKTPQYLAEAVYGLPELYRERIRGARLVANPGCFPTCSILAVAPLIRAGLIDPDSVIIDAKSGTTGAGRGAKVQNLFCEVNETIKAYGVTVHRHTPEIEDQLLGGGGKAAARAVHPASRPHEQRHPRHGLCRRRGGCGRCNHPGRPSWHLCGRALRARAGRRRRAGNPLGERQQFCGRRRDARQAHGKGHHDGCD